MTARGNVPPPDGSMAFAPDVVLQRSSDEMVLLKLSDETVFALNATGAEIAALVDQGLTLAAICDRVADMYGISREAAFDSVNVLIRWLVDTGLLIARDERTDAAGDQHGIGGVA